MELVLIKVSSRANHAVEAQKVLTEYGCNIAVRLGLHEITDESCSKDGLIILQVKPDKKDINGIEHSLNNIAEISVKTVSM